MILGGGFKSVLFSPLFGEDSHFDSYFSDGLKPPRDLPQMIQITARDLSQRIQARPKDYTDRILLRGLDLEPKQSY